MNEMQLIDGVQEGRCDMLDYVLRLSPEYRLGFETFCAELGLEQTAESAEEYLASRERDMSECVTIG